MLRLAFGLLALSRCGTFAAQAPDWLFPLDQPASQTQSSPDRPHHVPGSDVVYTSAQLDDLYSAPGWFPASYAWMPDIVAHGRKPNVYACGYCHTPAGQGRPENASLAGLPAGYIAQQLADFKSGARRSAAPEAFAPVDLMIALANRVTAEEADAAAAYFSGQHPVARIRVVETRTVSRSQVVGWVYATAAAGGREALGVRLMEFAPDVRRHEDRDDAMQYVAYVPPGSLSRGEAIARSGAGRFIACASCHGDTLQGVGDVPPLAGRLPSYLLRQLFAFRSGARAGAGSALMLPAVANLTIGDMIDVIAYAASLPP